MDGLALVVLIILQVALWQKTSGKVEEPDLLLTGLGGYVSCLSATQCDHKDWGEHREREGN